MLSHSGDTIVGGVRKVAFVRTELVDSIVFDEIENGFSDIRLKPNHSWNVIFPKENMTRFNQTLAEDNSGLWVMTLNLSVKYNSAGLPISEQINEDIKRGVLIVVEFNDNTKKLMGYSLKSKYRTAVSIAQANISNGISDVKSSMLESFSLIWKDFVPARNVNVIL